MSTESLKFSRAQNPTPSSSILVVYPRFNQDEWVSPLINSQHKSDSMVGGGAQDQWRKNMLRFLKKKKKKKIWDWLREWDCRVPKIHCIWIFGRDLSSQIISILNREGYFKQSNRSDSQKDKKRKFAHRGGQSETHRKNENQNVPQYKVQGLPIRET